MSEWKPISSVPVSERVDLWCRSTQSGAEMRVTDASFNTDENKFWLLREGKWLGAAYKYYAPTHWMLTPKGPTK